MIHNIPSMPREWHCTSSINWKNIFLAQEHYAALGFMPIEVPWFVPREANNVTKPNPENKTFVLGNGMELVGSAEQGFIYLMSQDLLPAGRWMSVSPCFRAEPVLDEYHQMYFMKLELWASTHLESPESLAKKSIEVFSSLLSVHAEQFHLVSTGSSSLDVEYGGVELGSYGLRAMPDGASFVYGTGLAEPRFSQVFLQK